MKPNPEPATRSFTVCETSTSPGSGERGDACAGDNRDPRKLFPHDLALAGMDSSADDASADLAMLGGETLVGNLFLPVGANRSAWSSRPSTTTDAHHSCS
jgi:hypothetical protein